MLDRERVLAKPDDLDGYLEELRQVVPETYSRYMESAEKRMRNRTFRATPLCSGLIWTTMTQPLV